MGTSEVLGEGMGGAVDLLDLHHPLGQAESGFEDSVKRWPIPSFITRRSTTTSIECW
jgi:hypothetical protein